MRYITAGEANGTALLCTVEDVPAGLRVAASSADADLERALVSYGRVCEIPPRARAEVLTGVRHGVTTGAPVVLRVLYDSGDAPESTDAVVPRLGTADMAGSLKIDTDDCRDVAAYAGEHELLCRVAASSLARELIASLGAEVHSYVAAIGSAMLREDDPTAQAASYEPLDIEMSEVRCPSPQVTRRMTAQIDKAREEGDTLGGIFRVVATGLPLGLGGTDATHNLASLVTAAVMGVPDVTGVELGCGFELARRRGSQYADVIDIERIEGFVRKANTLGGVEGGLTTGMPLVVSAAVRPGTGIAAHLASLNMEQLIPAHDPQPYRDVCTVAQRAVAAEGEVAFALANAYMDKFGHDSLSEIRTGVQSYLQRLKIAAR